MTRQACHSHPLCSCHDEPRQVDESMYSLWASLVSLLGQPFGGLLVNCGENIHEHPYVDPECLRELNAQEAR